MTFDLSAYGMGLGLVMVGWVCGMIVSYLFNIIRRLGAIG